MDTRTIRLRVFCSPKGGVGKSTLAVACAKLLAESKRTCVLIDADLTGTSLADGLRLRAPHVALNQDGIPDLFAAPTGDFLSRADTVRLRNERKWRVGSEQLASPVFLNDILQHGTLTNECRIDALLWKHEEDDGVWYLPSSPFEKDIAIALGWIYREPPFTWLQRMMWLLEGMRAQIPTLSDVVIDLPPGLFGFAHEALVLLSHLRLDREFPSGFPAWHKQTGSWEALPFLVTTPDRNDVLLAYEYLYAHVEELRGLRLLLNRNEDTQISELRKDLRAHFPENMGAENITPYRIDRLRPLAEIFTSRNLRMSEDVRRLREYLQIEETA